MIAPEDKYSWTVLSYCLCIFFLTAFAIYGMAYAKFMSAAETAKVPHPSI